MRAQKNKSQSCTSSKSILDFFRPGNSSGSNQKIVKTVSCPGCQEIVSESRLNFHLDKECSSKESSKMKNSHSYNNSKKKLKLEKKSKRVKKTGHCDSDEDDDISIINVYNKSIGRSSPSRDDKHINDGCKSDESCNSVSPEKSTDGPLETSSASADNDNKNFNLKSLMDDWEDDDESTANSLEINALSSLRNNEIVSNPAIKPESNICQRTVSSTSTHLLNTADKHVEQNSTSYNESAKSCNPSVCSSRNFPKSTTPIKNSSSKQSIESKIKLSPGIRRKIASFGLSPRKLKQGKQSQHSPQKLTPFSKGASCSRSLSKSFSDSNVGRLSSNDNYKEISWLNINLSSPKKKYSNPQQFRSVNGIYLDNFLTVLETISNSPIDYKLFLDDEKQVVENFHHLSLEARKLYVRLFQRNVKWKRVDKLDYPDTCDKDDTILYINELSYANYLHREDELSDIEEVLLLLNADDLVDLCKTMKINTTKKVKSELIQSLLECSKKQPTIRMMFKKADSNSSSSLLLKKAKALLGNCCRLNKYVRTIFLRMMMLFSLPRYDEDDESGKQLQLVTMLRVNLGQVKYPSNVTKLREKEIFRNREDLLMFEQCQELCTAVRESLDGQHWERALSYSARVDELYATLIADEQLLDHDMQLPDFLRRFSSLSILTYLKSCQVEALQRLRKYSEAIKVLRFLVTQKTHLLDYRGNWYDRLALNLEGHLKMRQEAMAAIKSALADPEVRVGHKLALTFRAQKIVNGKCRKNTFIKKRKKKDEETEDLQCDHCDAANILRGVPLLSPREAPRVVIEGRSFEQHRPGGAQGTAGFRRVFIRGDSDRHCGDGQVIACSVEELALEHYKTMGYTEGLHAEGSTINSLFGLLFWSCLYNVPVPDAFRLLHQSVPLDLDSLHFYKSRKQVIDDRVKYVATMTPEMVLKEVSMVWASHFQEHCIINWDLFKSPEHASGLILAHGVKLMSKICERLAKDHRFTRSGYPDLTMWNPETKNCKIVEVKGPNDRLSTKQILWLEYLLDCGADAEVCHVEAIGAKKMGRASLQTHSSPKNVNSPSKNLTGGPESCVKENCTPNLTLTSPDKKIEGTTKKRKKKVLSNKSKNFSVMNQDDSGSDEDFVLNTPTVNTKRRKC